MHGLIDKLGASQILQYHDSQWNSLICAIPDDKQQR